MLNKVMLIGRLGQDPELKYSHEGTAVCKFSVATAESYTDREGQRQEKTEWHRITAFQKLAETCANYLHKGSLVYVEGSLTTNKWTDKEGQTRYMTEVRASRIQFLDRKEQGGQANNHTGGPAKKAQEDDLGPAFPSEASGMDDVPF